MAPLSRRGRMTAVAERAARVAIFVSFYSREMHYHTFYKNSMIYCSCTEKRQKPYRQETLE